MSVIILSCFIGEDVPACGKRRTRDETLKGLTKSVHGTLCLACHVSPNLGMRVREPASVVPQRFLRTSMLQYNDSCVP